MQIYNIKWKNFNSYGNNWNEIDLRESSNGFYLIVGQNGFGKCVKNDTEIEIKFKDKKLEQKFNNFIVSRDI